MYMHVSAANVSTGKIYKKGIDLNLRFEIFCVLQKSPSEYITKKVNFNQGRSYTSLNVCLFV